MGKTSFNGQEMNQPNNIKCPECSAEINVSEILYHQVAEQIKKDYESKSVQKDQVYQEKLKNLEVGQKQLAKEKEASQQLIETAVKEKLNSEKIKLEKSIRSSLTEETAEQLKILNNELEQKSLQVKELNKSKAEIEKLKRDNDELRDKIILEKEKEYSEKLKEEKFKIQKLADEGSFLKIKELEKQLSDQKALAEEMQRKAKQGSMQLQGEVLELAIEEMLKEFFPFDLIEEVGKGVKGADIIHKVRNKSGFDCGIILYESKRTKAFSNDWISKLKNDAIGIKANVCVIITEALPDGMEGIGFRDGVWVCTFREVKGLVLIIRDSLIKISEAYNSQINKGEKMQMLYDYLTSAECKNQINAIVEGFSELQMGFNSEKYAMEKIWKKREKQLEKILLNTNHFIGSVQGIESNSFSDLKQINPTENKLIE